MALTGEYNFAFIRFFLIIRVIKASLGYLNLNYISQGVRHKPSQSYPLVTEMDMGDGDLFTKVAGELF